MGILLGLLGVVIVTADRGLSVAGLDGVGFAFCLLALVGITAATLYQKRFGSDVPMISGAAVQYLAVSVVLLPLALIFENNTIQWTATFVFALSWLIIVLSLGAVLLLMFLLFIWCPPSLPWKHGHYLTKNLPPLAWSVLCCAQPAWPWWFVSLRRYDAAACRCPGGDNEHWPRSGFGSTGVCTMSCNSFAPPTYLPLYQICGTVMGVFGPTIGFTRPNIS